MKKTIEVKDPIIGQVIDKILGRSNVGQEKYGITLKEDDPINLDKWLNHLQEELMDAVNYIEKVRDVIKIRNIEVKIEPALYPFTPYHDNISRSDLHDLEEEEAEK